MDDVNAAREAYFSLLTNYEIYKRGEFDKQSAYNRFVNAAENLAKANVPNPFREMAELEAPMVRPRDDVPGVQVVTAVDADHFDVDEDVKQLEEANEEPVEAEEEVMAEEPAKGEVVLNWIEMGDPDELEEASVDEDE